MNTSVNIALSLLIVFTARVPLVAAPTVSHLTSSTVAETGRTRVIAFRIDPPAQGNTTLEAEIADRDILAVVNPPAILNGETLGFVRVRGIKVGETTLSISGSALPVKVIPQRMPIDKIREAPRIITPVSGATIWGESTIGVELTTDRQNLLDAPVNLELSDGTKIRPASDRHPFNGPTRRLTFVIDARRLNSGVQELVAVAELKDGTRVPGSPVRVSVATPQQGHIKVIESEAQQDFPWKEHLAKASAELAEDLRDEDFDFVVMAEDEASGGEYVRQQGMLPPVSFFLDAQQEGFYQVMVNARGKFNSGTYPSIGINVDYKLKPLFLTAGCLVGRQWNRVAIGKPLRLAKGKHILSAIHAEPNFCEADFTFDLDKIEICRLEDQPGQNRKDLSANTTKHPSRESENSLMRLLSKDGRMMVSPEMLEQEQSAIPSFVYVGFARPLHGKTVTGILEIVAGCRWSGEESGGRPPEVSLIINGETISTQCASEPSFMVDPAWFGPGENSVQLKAVIDSGESYTSPPQKVLKPSPDGLSPREAGFRPRGRRFFRFTVHDNAWTGETRQFLSSFEEEQGDEGEGDEAEKEETGEKAFKVGPGKQAVLNLPEDLKGEFEILLEAQSSNGRPSHILAGLNTSLGLIGTEPIEIPGWQEMVSLQVSSFSEGKKQLILSLGDDRQGAFFWIHSLVLQETPLFEDMESPAVRIVYPPEGQSVWREDVVVVEAADDQAVAFAQVIVDGLESSPPVELEGHSGRVVMPLLLREVKPGPHTLTVRVMDSAEHVTASREQEVHVLAERPRKLNQYHRAVHILNRFAYGPNTTDLAAILTLGEETWLESALSRGLNGPGEQAALSNAMAVFLDGSSEDEIGGRVVLHALYTPNPVRTRFVLWAANHFNTWARKVEGEAKWIEHLTFMRLGAAPFSDLLFTSATSPAMLFYLDQTGSRANSINENYAREIMELHTLGVNAGYTQEDVTALARLLTGWMFSEEGDGRPGPLLRRTFRFDPQRNDRKALRIFGLAFPAASPAQRYDRARHAIEMLASHPATARFISRKLAEHYVAVPAPEDLVKDLAKVFLETHGDLKALLLAIARHPVFEKEGLHQKIAAPFDYAIRLFRACEQYDPWQAVEFLERNGKAVFDCPTPDGYPEEDSAYSDTNAVLLRWGLANDIKWELRSLLPGTLMDEDEEFSRDWQQTAVDWLAIRLTGSLLSEGSNQAALSLLQRVGANREEALLVAASFVAQLPEASLR